MIDALGLAGFFLLHRDLLELAREVAVEVRGPGSARALLPPGRGRGSSVSSIVCYLTGLSHIDPIANELFLGRFLNEELDRAAGHRPRLPARHPRGPDPARARPLRARALGAGRRVPDVPLARGDPRARQGPRPAAGRARAGRARGRAVRGPRRGGATSRSRSGSSPAGRPAPWLDPDAPRAVRDDHRASGWRWSTAADPAAPRSASPPDEQRATPRCPAAGRWLARLCDEAYGLPRHLSQHSGGMIVSTRPLVDCCPVLPAAMEGRQLCQWDKDSCADAGFLKIDLLGLGMLSAVERCVEDDRAHARRADRPLAHPVRRRGHLRRDPGAPTRWASSRSRARAQMAVAAPHAARDRWTTSRSRSRSCARARSSAARSTPTSRAASGCARTRTTSCPTTTRRCEPVLQATRSARSSSRTR